MIRKGLSLLTACLLVAACTAGRNDLDLEESTIPELQSLMTDGRLTAHELTEYYLERIERLDRGGPRLNSIIELNDDALAIADALDRERQAQGPRGPLHGIPVVLKANIDTADSMSTTAGSLALEGHHAPEDAYLVTRLREAGAVILGKANLSEWANFRSTRSTSGWSSLGGQTKNPYDPSRNPCGSSSGSAVAVSANLTVIAVGTETSGSIVCPAGINGIVGIKPTLGRVSRQGIVPVAHSQDTAGPMARTVRDAAILLTAMAGADSGDPITVGAPAPDDYAVGLDAASLAGKRIGVWRTYTGAQDQVAVRETLDRSVELMRAQGAEIVDPVGIDPARVAAASGASLIVLEYEFKNDLGRYLEQSGAKVRSLADVIAFNSAHTDRVMPFFGQERMKQAQARGTLADREYLNALAASKGIARRIMRTALDTETLDALVVPTNGAAWVTDPAQGDAFHVGSAGLAAISGFPSITVPAGFIEGLPVGISFIGEEWGEKELIAIAYAFEQASQARTPP